MQNYAFSAFAAPHSEHLNRSPLSSFALPSGALQDDGRFSEPSTTDQTAIAAEFPSESGDYTPPKGTPPDAAIAPARQHAHIRSVRSLPGCADGGMTARPDAVEWPVSAKRIWKAARP
jgi:hypothetical protein